MMMAMGARRPAVPVEHTKTFTANEAWPPPPGVIKLTKATGFGAHGKNGTSGTVVKQYQISSTSKTIYPDGSVHTYPLSTSGNFAGSKPGDYCDPYTTDDFGRKSTVCYHFTDTSYTTGTSATTGASATGFGKVFPGSTGNVDPAVTTFTDIPLTAGQPYNVVVPTGGSITITWLE